MAAKDGTDICFVVPAFDSVRHAPLGASTLIASCRARGFTVGAVHASLLLAGRIGFELYQEIADMLPTRQPGEYIFKPFAYPPEALAKIPAGMESPKAVDVIAAASPAIDAHLDETVAAIVALKPRIIAITNTFQQSLPGFAIARRLRGVLPEAMIVMGGANVAGVMATGLAKVFDCIDHFFDGEGDIAFPLFCDNYLHSGHRPDSRVVACEPIADMDVVPLPDFSDFVAALAVQQAAGRLPPHLPDHATYESSRGCWWGAKHHCTFCGLNARGMAFREKSPDRIVAEIRTLAADWPNKVIRTADNIMPVSFFDTVLPALAAFDDRPLLFYEVKANLKDAQLAAMRRAGIYSIQPGIESLSTPVLKLMRKGVSAHQNVALLRMCAMHGMRVGWNLIYGFPGETCDHYREVMHLIPSIVHLMPPDGFSRIMLDRFSPYFEDHQSFGIPSVRPFEAYLGLYPSDVPLHDIAYHFWGDYTTPFLSDTPLREAFSATVERWQALWTDRRHPQLETMVTPGGKPIIVDTRSLDGSEIVELSPQADEVLALLERPHALEALPAFATGLVDELLTKRYVVAHEGVLLSVVVRRHAIEHPGAATIPRKARVLAPV